MALVIIVGGRRHVGKACFFCNLADKHQMCTQIDCLRYFHADISVCTAGYSKGSVVETLYIGEVFEFVDRAP